MSILASKSPTLQSVVAPPQRLVPPRRTIDWSNRFGQSSGIVSRNHSVTILTSIASEPAQVYKGSPPSSTTHVTLRFKQVCVAFLVASVLTLTVGPWLNVAMQAAQGVPAAGESDASVPCCGMNGWQSRWPWPRVCTTAHSARRRPGPERWRSRTSTKRHDDRRLLHRGCGRESCRIPRRRGVLGSTVASAMSSFWPSMSLCCSGTAGGRICAGLPRGGVHGVGPFWLLQVPSLARADEGSRAAEASAPEEEEEEEERDSSDLFLTLHSWPRSSPTLALACSPCWFCWFLCTL